MSLYDPVPPPTPPPLPRNIRFEPSVEEFTALPSMPTGNHQDVAPRLSRTPIKLKKQRPVNKQKPLPRTPEKTPVLSGRQTPMVIGEPTGFQRVGGIELLQKLQAEENERAQRTEDHKTPLSTKKSKTARILTSVDADQLLTLLHRRNIQIGCAVTNLEGFRGLYKDTLYTA